MRDLRIYVAFDREKANVRREIPVKLGPIESKRTVLERVRYKTTHSFKNVVRDRVDTIINYILDEGYKITKIQYGHELLPIPKND